MSVSSSLEADHPLKQKPTHQWHSCIEQQMNSLRQPWEKWSGIGSSDHRNWSWQTCNPPKSLWWLHPPRLKWFFRDSCSFSFRMFWKAFLFHLEKARMGTQHLSSSLHHYQHQNRLLPFMKVETQRYPSFLHHFLPFRQPHSSCNHPYWFYWFPKAFRRWDFPLAHRRFLELQLSLCPSW